MTSAPWALERFALNVSSPRLPPATRRVKLLHLAGRNLLHSQSHGRHVEADIGACGTGVICNLQSS